MYNFIVIDYYIRHAFPEIRTGDKKKVWRAYQEFVESALDKGYSLNGDLASGDVELYYGDMLAYRVAVDKVYKL